MTVQVGAKCSLNFFFFEKAVTEVFLEFVLLADKYLKLGAFHSQGEPKN